MEGSSRDGEETGGGSSSSAVAHGNEEGVTRIRVKTLDDREIHITVNLDAPVSSIRDELYEKLGVAVENQRIIFQGRVLNWNSTLRSYGIEDGYTIHIVDRPAPRPSIENLSQALSELSQTGSIRNNGSRSNRTVEQTTRNGDDAPRRSGIRWRVFIEDNEFTRRRDELEQTVRNVIGSLPYLEPQLKRNFVTGWQNNELHIQFPIARPHIASPAFERLSFVEMGVNQLRHFLDIVTEENGLVQEVRRLVSQMRIDAIFDTYSQVEQAEAAARMRRLVVRLETLNTDLSVSRPAGAEWQRLRQSTPSEREARLQRVDAGNHHPEYVMRHAIDSDLIAVSRAFREQRRRFIEIEDVLDEVLESRLLSYVQMSMQNPEDYRNLAISTYYTYMQRMRHHISHISHILSDIEVPFERSHGPIRLVPQYETNALHVPQPHSGVLILSFRTPATTGQTNTVQISRIFAPPRLRTDVGRLQSGEWPHLTFFPTGMMQEQHAIMMEVVPDMGGGNERRFGAMLRVEPSTGGRRPTTTTSTNAANAPNLPPILRTAAAAAAAAMRRPAENAGAAAEGGDAEAPRQGRSSVSRSTLQNLRRALSSINERLSGRSGTSGQSNPSSRPSAQQQQPSRAAETRAPISQTRGPETDTLAAFPQQISPSELRNIARNIASRYRDEALQRIAQNLTRLFSEQVPPWDTRIDSLSTGTLREILAIVLELLTSTGRNIEESREMMLALVRDEEVLIRSITESMKSLFLQGEFPTHVNRVILPRPETVGQRTDYESRDGSDSDEYDGMLVRVASDVSQPQSGSLRLLALERAERRRIAEYRRQRQAQHGGSSSSSSSATAVPPSPSAPSPSIRVGGGTTRAQIVTGPSLGPEDMAEVVLGELPLGQRTILQPSVLREAALAAAAAARVNSNPERMQIDSDDQAEMQVVISAGFPDQPGSSNQMPPGFPNDDSFSDLEGLFDEAAQQIGTNTNRQMISLDPFLSCNSRHLDFNRSMRIAGPNAERLTAISQDPNPEFSEFLQAQSVPPYRQETVAEESDFTYEVRRYHETGEMIFSNGDDGRAQFQQMIRTAIRSLLGHMIEMDAIVVLNSDLNTTIPSAARTNVLDMISRQLSRPEMSIRMPFGEAIMFPRTPSPSPQRGGGGGANNARQRGRVSSPNRDVAIGRTLVRHHPRNYPFNHPPESGEPISTQRVVEENAFFNTDIYTQQDRNSLARFLQRLHGVETREMFNRGMLGILLSFNQRVFQLEDYPDLLAYQSAVEVFDRRHEAIRQHIVDTFLSGNASTRSRGEFDRIAGEIMTPESFFNLFMQYTSPHQPLCFHRGRSIYQMSWALQVTERESLRELLELCTRNISGRRFSKEFLRIIIQLLHRVYGIFQLYCAVGMSSERNFLMNRLPGFAFGIPLLNLPDIHYYYWEILIDWWESIIHENNVRRTLEFLDIQYAVYPPQNPPIPGAPPPGHLLRPRIESTSSEDGEEEEAEAETSSGSEPASSSRVANGCERVVGPMNVENREGESSAKRRRCDGEEMDVDVAEEAREDMVMEGGSRDADEQQRNEK